MLQYIGVSEEDALPALRIVLGLVSPDSLGNGIELGGHATGVQVTETAVGTDSSIQTAIPNGGDGIKIDGHAHGNAIGGFQPSIEPQVTISANRGYGIQMTGSASDNVVFHSDIGTNGEDTADLGNNPRFDQLTKAPEIDEREVLRQDPRNNKQGKLVLSGITLKKKWGFS